MFLFDDSKKNTWYTIKRDVSSEGREYTIKYRVTTDGYLNITCNRNSAEFYIKLEQLYNYIKYIKLLLEHGFVNDSRRGEKNIATGKAYNPTIFREAFGDDTQYFSGNNWWEKDLITVMEFLISNSGREVIKKYTGDRLKTELNKLSINCLDKILKEVEDEKNL